MEQRDFFISYTKTDKAWAVWIADALKRNGYSVYVQALDIRPGDDFLEKMEEFLEKSRNFIVVWSKAYSKSRYCMNELRAAFHEWNAGRINCLLPVRVDDFPMKALYSALVHVELSDRGAASEATLADAVRRAVPRPNADTVRNVTPRTTVTATNTLEPKEDAAMLRQRGYDYEIGRNGVNQDYAKAREYYEKAAKQGYAQALNDLGFLYEHGYGVAQDYAKARQYYEQAAAKGSVGALTNLGRLYDNGNGVAQDYAKARQYYEQAAAKGSAAALNNLGILYDNGNGVAQDYAKARQYYEQAAAKGSAGALWNLALLYENGQGVTRDYSKALEYYQKAADAGNKDAPAKVAKLRKKLNR